MAGRDQGQTETEEGETPPAGTGFRFDATDAAADRAPDGREPTGHTAVGDGVPTAGDGSDDGERVRDERARGALNERLAAVERAMTGADAGPADLSGEAAREERLEELVDRLDDIESRVAELEGGLQAVRGYVGDLRAVNRDVERRADAALAATRGDGPRNEDGHESRPGWAPDAPGERERRPETRNDTGGTDRSGHVRPGRCERCGRAGDAPGAEDADGHGGPGTIARTDRGDGDREPDSPAARDRGGSVRRGRESDRADERVGSESDRDPEPVPGMGTALDARADGYRPPAVAPEDGDGDGGGDGPLARLREAL